MKKEILKIPFVSVKSKKKKQSPQNTVTMILHIMAILLIILKIIPVSHQYLLLICLIHILGSNIQFFFGSTHKCDPHNF